MRCHSLGSWGIKTALLLLEIQNDYFNGGRKPLADSLTVSKRASMVLHHYREQQWPVIYLQHVFTHPNASYLLPCTKGIDFHDSIKPRSNELIIKKHYPNSFKDTSLLNYLTKHHIEQLVICGMMTHMSIDSTVRAAYDLGFICTVLADACATQPLSYNDTTIATAYVQSAFLSALESNYATVINTEIFLQKSYATPELLST